MLSKMAKNDLMSLREQGYQPTDEEIIKLNDLALKIERGKETTPANMPRIAFAGNIILHEPTIGSMQWWNDYGQDACFSNKGRLMTHYFSLFHAKDVEYLNTLTKPCDIRKAVREWKKTVDATEDELWRALCWVKWGNGDMDENPNKEKILSSIDDQEQMDMLWMTVIASAGSLGLTPDDLKTTTKSEMVHLMVQANLLAHIPMKQSVARDYIAYRQLLKTIEERGESNG